MDTTSSVNWFDLNQRHLSAALEPVRMRLEARVDPEALPDKPSEGTPRKPEESAPLAPPALVTLCAAFSLSPFERDLLLLCAGVELDSRFSALCALAQNDPARPFPTFSLALAILPEPHWSALTPAAPLRYWRLIEVSAGNAVTQSALHIDERILNYLTGTSHMDERLAGYVRPLVADVELVPSHAALAKDIVDGWSGSRPLVIQLCGREPAARRNIAACACAALGMNLSILPGYAIPANPLESESLRRLWEREAVLGVRALYLDCDDVDTDPAQEACLRRWIENAGYPLIVSGRSHMAMGSRHSLSFDVDKPTAAEQRELWQSALGPAAASLNGRVEALVAQFSLDSQTIRQIALDALQRPASTPDELGHALWQACSNHAHPRLGELAQRIRPMSHWDDLVLPEAQSQTLRDVARQIRQRLKVYESWGFAGKSSRGLGISALFAGGSGTGKTMAAEVLANELGLELYRIDLSQVISKYIGETEKNLGRVFDVAEESSAILLFDEADALFGKRSEVKDSHDRYANVEISYLLQRMEAYRGLAILTTNMKEALDQAFLRRIRFIVQFPFPDASQRAEIWRRVFPAQTPTENLDAYRLARLTVTGGNIRNIALYAAFLAADSSEPVRMAHLLRAVRAEFAKLEKPLTEAEIGGWV